MMLQCSYRLEITMGYYDILKLRQAYEIGLAKFTILVSLNPKPIREYEISGSLVNLIKFQHYTMNLQAFLIFLLFLQNLIKPIYN